MSILKSHSVWNATLGPPTLHKKRQKKKHISNLTLYFFVKFLIITFTHHIGFSATPNNTCPCILEHIGFLSITLLKAAIQYYIIVMYYYISVMYYYF